MSNKYLLNVSIGPVQEFIAEARKTRDLWIGSYLLSILTYKAIEPFINGNYEIIYPHLSGSPLYKNFHGQSGSSEDLQIASLPNHFLVIIPQDEINALINASKERYETYWEGLANSVKNKIQQEFNKTSNSWDSLWDNQIRDHWYYMWVAIPVSDDNLNNSYQSKAKEIQRFLDERKLTRTFKQWEGTSAIKCTQCGCREVLGPVDLAENSNFWKKIGERFKWNIRKGDRICAICLIKRFLESSFIKSDLKAPRFESTMDIAVIPYKKVLENLNPSEKDNLIKTVKNLMKSLKFNVFPANISEIKGDFLYIDELSPDKLIKEHFPELKDDEKIKKKNELINHSQKLQDLLRGILKEHKANPSKYYAVLFMDGDNIGKWLSGTLPKGQTSFTKDEHKERSKKLGELGVKVIPEILRGFSACPIYSGGDDLLALSFLDDILQMSLELRRGFSSKGIHPGATISAGIVIAHYSYSFKRALEEGRKAVEKAKNIWDDKDTFWITLILSSGIYVEGGFKWFLNNVTIIEKILSPLIEWLKKEELSPRFIYDVFDSIDVFYEENNRLNVNMFKDEIKRLFLRHFELNNKIDEFIENLSIIASHSSYPIDKGIDAKENFISLLRIASFIARESVRWE